MKKLIAAACFVFGLPAHAGDLKFIDNQSNFIGEITKISFTGTDIVWGVASAGNGVARFIATNDDLYHWNSVYYAETDCNHFQPFYFKIDYSVSPSDTNNSEGRIAFSNDLLWAVFPNPPSTAPIVKSLVHPWGFCQNITPQTLPGPLSDWRENGAVLAVFHEPFKALSATLVTDEIRIKESNNTHVIGIVAEALVVDGTRELRGLSQILANGQHGVIRFRYRDTHPNELHHYNRVYFTTAGCDASSPTNVYFKLDAPVSGTHPLDASGRAAIYLDREYHTELTPPASAPTVQSYRDPFGACVSTSGTLPTPLNVYRKALSANIQLSTPYLIN